MIVCSEAVLRCLVEKLRLLLAHVIAVMDTNRNMRILKQNNLEWLQQIWFDIAADREIMGLFYNHLTLLGSKTETQHVLVPSTGFQNRDFSGKFPFSWMLKDKIEKLLNSCAQNRTSGEPMSKSCPNKDVH